MNFLIDNLTSIENLNFFSTPKFRDIHLDKNNTNKNNIFKFEPISKNSKNFYGSKNQLHKNIINHGKTSENNNLENPENNNKKEIYLKENFSLSSLNNNSSQIDKSSVSKNILDIKINESTKKEKEEINNMALISFCDKSDNYSFNNYSYSTNKEKIEINNNNNVNLPKEKNYKESEIQSQSNKSNNSNSNGNNSTSFKYNLPLENDKIPLINNFTSFQDNNLENNIEKGEKLLGLAQNIKHFEKIDINNLRKNKSIKEDLFFKNKENNITSNINISDRKYLTEKKPKMDESLTKEKENKDSEELNKKNNSSLEQSKKNTKNLIKKNILHSYDNYTKIKRKIKISTINEISNKFNIIKTEKKEKTDDKFNWKINKIESPRKKFELIIKQIDINIGNNNQNEEIDNFNDFFSYTTREPKIRYSMTNESNLNSHREIKKNFYLKKNNNTNIINNTNPNRISNTTNRLKSKNRKIIKPNSEYDYNKTFFNFNRSKNNILINDKSKEMDYLNKKINTSLSNHFKKKTKKDFINNNKKNSYHTRNISNLYSNKIFNGVKSLFNINKNIIINTINYETNDINKNCTNNNILQTQIKIKPHIKNIIKKRTYLKKPNDNIFQKSIQPLFLKSNNNSKFKNSDNINNRYHTILLDKNNKSKDNPNILPKKIKPKKIIKNKITSFNKPKNYLLNNKINKNIIKIENKNQSTNQLTNIISGSNTDRTIGIKNNNFSSVNIDNKSIINDSIFINVNDSTNSLQKYNKIKVNKINMHKRIPKSELSSNIGNKTNSYWKIHKKPKNSCLLNNYNNEVNKKEDNNINNKCHITLGASYEKYLNGNSQILLFNKYKPTKFHDLDNIKEKIHKYNLTNNNSKSIISESSYTDRNNYNTSINENLNIEKTKKEMGNMAYKEKERNNQYNNPYKIYKNKNNSFKTKLDQLPSKINKTNKLKNQNFKEEVIKYSILRNNKNNQIINEFSIILGEDKEKNKSIIKEKNNINDKIIGNANKSIENQKTIINVNQFYPSYYIDTHEIVTK